MNMDDVAKDRLEIRYRYISRWVQVTGDKSTEKYREIKEDSDDEDIKPIIKTERLSPCEQERDTTGFSDMNCVKVLPGLHLTFNLEAGSLLPLAIKLVTEFFRNTYYKISDVIIYGLTSFFFFLLQRKSYARKAFYV